MRREQSKYNFSSAVRNDRFDNIYVVKLLESSIRNGVQRVEATHMKGEEVKRLVLSDFKMEQVSLFDFMEE